MAEALNLASGDRLARRRRLPARRHLGAARRPPGGRRRRRAGAAGRKRQAARQGGEPGGAAPTATAPRPSSSAPARSPHACSASHSETVDFVDHYRGHGPRLRLRLGGALDPRRGLPQDRAAGALRRSSRRAASHPAASRTSACRVRWRAWRLRSPRRPGFAEASVRDNLAGRMRRDRDRASARHAGPRARGGQARRAHPGDELRPGLRCAALRGDRRTRRAAAERAALRARSRGARRRATTRNTSPSTTSSRSSAACARSSTSRRRSSTLYRKRDMLLGLVGGRCSVCGTLQFPKSNICVNPNCNAVGTQDDQPFADLDGPRHVLHRRPADLHARPAPALRHGALSPRAGG